MAHHFIKDITAYYSQRVIEYGATHAGVDWNSTDSQCLRFDQLLRGAASLQESTILDYGCGYGALALYLAQNGGFGQYTGFDISPEMIDKAKHECGALANCRFATDRTDVEVSDVTLASGIFNVRLTTPDSEWLQYVETTLLDMASLSRSWFAFNMLTAYSDEDRKRDYLYYADPHHIFDFCRTRISRSVALLHDYPLYEFTVIVRT